MSLGQWPASLACPDVVLVWVNSGGMQGIELPDVRAQVRVHGITYLASAFKMTLREMRDIFRRIGQDDILTVYDLFEEFTPTVFTNGWRNVVPMAETERRLAR